MKGGGFLMENIEEKDKKTILIVDDEKPIVDILVYNLENSGSASSPSPIEKASKKSATGSALYAQGPPPTIIGASSPLSDARRGIPASSSILRTFV